MEGDCSMQGESSSNKSDECHEPLCQDLETDEVIDTPKLGMEFDTFDALLEHYARYARQEGFAVCKRTSKKGKDGKMRYAVIECYRGGKPRVRGANTLKPRPQSKLECPARVRACLSENEKWRLTMVCLEHNHEQSPEKVKHLNSFKKHDDGTKRKHEVNGFDGIQQTLNVRQIEAGELRQCTFNQWNGQNYLSNTWRLQLMEGDVEAMNRYFSRMKADNEDFFYALDLDGEGRLKNVFWADARSRVACKEFGDVVTFDTTYLVEKYVMPFAPFVSVNHHGHFVLLGCGLVSHEDTESYIWLFETWLTCMRGSAPKAIITDQCTAIKSAIEYVFPAIRHRWCILHVMKKAAENLHGLMEYEQIIYCMRQVVYDSLTVEEFEASWLEFITKYDLLNNTWLKELYVERVRWVPVFVKSLFLAGMCPTQLGDNISAYFDGYINKNTTLKQFVDQYEYVLTKKVEIEREQDTKSWKSFIPCISEDTLETQFQSVYTNDKVLEFQREIRRRLNCQIWTRSESEYEIKEWVFIGEGDNKQEKRVSFKVSFNKDTGETQCSCHLFEFKGMVCAHQLMVWNDNGVRKVPDRYVFKRWCKNVKRVHTKVPICYDKFSKGIEMRRRENMYNIFKDVVELAEDRKEKYEKVMAICHGLKRDFDQASSVRRSNANVGMSDNDGRFCSLRDVPVPLRSIPMVDLEPKNQ